MLSALRRAAARVRALFRASALDRDLKDELLAHTLLLVEENLRRGMSAAEAERSARLALGPSLRLAEDHRAARGIPFVDALRQDLRYAFRTLRRDRGFSMFAVLIVALGIGASSVVFTLVNALLLRPLPFRHPEQLVWIANGGAEGDLSGQTLPVQPFLDLRSQARSLSDVAAFFAFYGSGDRKMTGEGEPERLTAVPVSQGFFPLLGVRPRLGRVFTNEECDQNLPVVVLGATFWARRFASDPEIVGSKVTLDGKPYTVLGVLPSSFDFGSVFAPGRRIDLFLPLPLTAEVDSMGNTLSVIGRMRPGVSLRQAQAELGALGPPIATHRGRDGLAFVATALREHVSGRLRPALFLLVCAAGVVMLIVCANLSNLQLSRAASQQKELALRTALGAGRGRLVRQMLTESLLLSFGAALLGVALAAAGTRLLSRLDAIVLPLREGVRLDFRAVGVAVLLALVTGIAVGLASALRVPDRTVQETLKEGGRGSREGGRSRWLRSVLVVAEVTFACVLLVCAGLLVRSLVRVLDVDLGFRPEQAMALRLDIGSAPTRALTNARWNEVLRVVEELPGVQAAGLTDALPLGSNRSWSAGAKGRSYSLQHPPPDVFVRIVSEGYLRAMGIPLRSGRDLSSRDDATSRPVMLINETLARTLWPGQDAVGQTAIHVDVDREVVGVVADVRHLAPDQGSGNEMYLPIRQTRDYSSIDLVVKTAQSPAALDRALREALHTLEPNLPQNGVRTLESVVDRAVSPRRFLVMVLSGFSAFALLLASLGIYAVISYSVQQRSHEIGLRMALGASAAGVERQIVLRSLRLAGFGMLIGGLASWALSRTLSGFLFGVSPTDPATFAAMLGILGIVAGAAGYIPARQASRIDPLTALRAE